MQAYSLQITAICQRGYFFHYQQTFPSTPTTPPPSPTIRPARPPQPPKQPCHRLLSLTVKAQSSQAEDFKSTFIFQLLIINSLYMQNQPQQYLLPVFTYFPFINVPEYWNASYLQESPPQQSSENCVTSPLKVNSPTKTIDCKMETAWQSPLVAAETPKRVVKIEKAAKLKKSEKDYRPYQRKEKRKEVVLKPDRNVLPIKIKQMLSYLGRQGKSQQMVKRYFQSFNTLAVCTEKRFYSYIKAKKGRVGNYVKLQVLGKFLSQQPQEQAFYSSQQQKFYLQLVRALLRHYLSEVAVLCTLNSNRINSQQKIDHLRAQRTLSNCLTSNQFC